MSDDQITKAAGSNAGSASGQSLLTEVGRGGLRHWGGYIYDEDPQLRGLQAIRKYREMTKDPTIAAMLFALTALFRSVSWRIEASGDTPAHCEARDLKISLTSRKCLIEARLEQTASTMLSSPTSMISGGMPLSR
ncbi:hypothetical protein [Azospirillum brasilense]|uniref:hypothetical protein n=1 Tax=Azospirillum brasilense TaxID=192 RepID=UPI000E67C4A7|nr:hypothetical protein [Azospirillum brasilense]NUB27435.1 hypothetical protein [Azospirillum brasilense]NUB31146.1 hypothetical protein [Azospirillum brasilense]RIW04142.1 hypothetical protein D2T81_11655 [Azospirillum brasilense]